MPHHNIVLTGFMGTGKSTVGPLVADTLDFRFVDTDALITAHAGKPIARIFDEDGESTFRELEAAVCEHIAWEPNTVIATGGGALLNTRTRDAFIAWGLVICLHASLEVITTRVGDDPTRPLFSSPTEAAALYYERQPIYNSLPHHITTDGKSPEAIAKEVVALWQR